MSSYPEQIKHCVSQLKQLLVESGIESEIESFVILGSGLNAVVDGFEVLAEIDYSQIVGLPIPTTPSHQGKFTVVKIGGQYTVFCQGRFHLYEGHSAQSAAILIFILKELGATQMIVTNAAGALNSGYQTGEVVLINDHINLTGHNPLLGLDLSFTNIFADMSNAYDNTLRNRAHTAASQHNIVAHSGTYAAVLGPSLETSAERRMLRSFGADIVGMSTAMEVIAANSCGMKVLGISAVTNMATGGADQQADTIEDVLNNAAMAAKGIKEIIREVLS